MDTETRLTSDDCLHYGNNHATVRNMECSPTESWHGRYSCRSCRCGRYQQHVDGCRRPKEAENENHVGN